MIAPCARSDADDEQKESTMIGGANPVGRARQELRQLFPDDEDFEGAVEWARRVFAAEQIDADSASLRSVRALRKNDRRLSRIAARYLAEAAAGKRPGERTSSFNPHLE